MTTAPLKSPGDAPGGQSHWSQPDSDRGPASPNQGTPALGAAPGQIIRSTASAAYQPQ